LGTRPDRRPAGLWVKGCVETPLDKRNECTDVLGYSIVATVHSRTNVPCTSGALAQK
jgi:hypothetical protein